MRTISAHDLLEADAMRDPSGRCKTDGCLRTSWKAGYCRRCIIRVIESRRGELSAIADARDAATTPPEEDTVTVATVESLIELRELIVERGYLPTSTETASRRPGLVDRLKLDLGTWSAAVERLGFPRPHRGNRSSEETAAIDARVLELRDEAGWTMPPPPEPEDRPEVVVDLRPEDGWPEGISIYAASPDEPLLIPGPIPDLEFEAADHATADGRDAEVAAAEGGRR